MSIKSPIITRPICVPRPAFLSGTIGVKLFILCKTQARCLIVLGRDYCGTMRACDVPPSSRPTLGISKPKERL